MFSFQEITTNFKNTNIRIICKASNPISRNIHNAKKAIH